MADIFGTPGDDVLNGTGGDDLIDGLDGNDTIRAGGGADFIYGGLGLDQMYGDGGNDTLVISSIHDIVAGELYDGGTGTDTLLIDYDPFSSGSAIFDLTGVSLTRLERLESFYHPVLLTRAQMSGFSNLQGTFRLADGGSISLVGKETSGTLELSNSFTTLDMRSAVNSSFLRIYAGTGGANVQGSDFEEILYGGAGNDVLRGNGGNDDLRSGGGIDQLYGGDGDDIIYFYGTEADAGGTVDGGSGYDTLGFQITDNDILLSSLSYTGIEAISVSVSFANQAALQVSAAQLNALNAINGGYFRIMDSGSVILTGLTIDAFLLLGNVVTNFSIAATNSVHARVFAGTGNVTITGSAVADGLYGNSGNDVIYGGGGHDGLSGGAGNDDLYGEDGDDFLEGGLGIDRLYGGLGDDELSIGDLTALNGEIYDGDAGFDVLSLNASGSFAGGVDISAATLAGIEAIDGGTTQFSYLTTAQFMSAQQLTGWLALTDAGLVSLNGKVVHSLGASVLGGVLEVGLSEFGNTIDLSGIIGNFSVNVFGGSGNDTILGGARGATLRGGGGDDMIVSRTTFMSDNILAGEGNDTLDARLGFGGLNGEGGNDVLMVSGMSSGSALSGGIGRDRLVVEGSFQTGTVFSGMEEIELVGGATLTMTSLQRTNGLSNDASISGTGSIIINMSFGSELLLQKLVVAGGSSVSFVVNGSSGTDIIKGATEAVNIINAGDGSDTFRGGLLADILNGGAGSDKMEGGPGADMLTGGTGADQFRYQHLDGSNAAWGIDTITDFEVGVDDINLSLIDTNPVAAGDQGFTFVGTDAFLVNGTAQLRYATSGANLVVQMDVDGNGTTDMEIILQGRAGQTLTAGDFIL